MASQFTSKYLSLVEGEVPTPVCHVLQAAHAVKINQEIAGASENITNKKYDK